MLQLEAESHKSLHRVQGWSLGKLADKIPSVATDALHKGHKMALEEAHNGEERVAEQLLNRATTAILEEREEDTPEGEEDTLCEDTMSSAHSTDSTANCEAFKAYCAVEGNIGEKMREECRLTCGACS